MSQVCNSYGLSDVGLAKVCAELSIPRPPRGYWAKKRNGKPTRRTPLRPLDNPDWEIIEFYKYPDASAPDASANKEVEQLLANEKRAENRIVVATALRVGGMIRNDPLKGLKVKKKPSRGRSRAGRETRSKRF